MKSMVNKIISINPILKGLNKVSKNLFSNLFSPSFIKFNSYEFTISLEFYWKVAN